MRKDTNMNKKILIVSHNGTKKIDFNKYVDDDTIIISTEGKSDAEYLRTIFSNNLNYYMNKNGKTRTDLKNKLGISYSTVRDWANGVKYPRPDSIKVLADYFKISQSDLIEKRQNNKIPVFESIYLDEDSPPLYYEELSKKWTVENKEYFGLKIIDDSMSPWCCINDVIIFEKTNDFNDGDYCAILINNKTIFRKVLKNEAGITLMALNENKFDSIFYSNKQIKDHPLIVVGVAKELRRAI